MKEKLLKAIKHFKDEIKILEGHIAPGGENEHDQSACILAIENLEMVVRELEEIINEKEVENE